MTEVEITEIPPLSPGEMSLLNMHSVLRYRRVVVDGTGRGCFYIQDAGTRVGGSAGLRWYYSGRNAWEPKGQSRVVIPTPGVLAACEKQGGWYLGVQWSKITAH